MYQNLVFATLVMCNKLVDIKTLKKYYEEIASTPPQGGNSILVNSFPEITLNDHTQKIILINGEIYVRPFL